MSIESSGYRGLSDGLRPHWLAFWPIARTGVLLVLRRKLFWILLGLALMNFLFVFAMIYFAAQFTAENSRAQQFIERMPPFVSGTGRGYRDFMFAQGTVTMLLLAFAGATLVGNDHRHGGLTFYLSRRISRAHYVAGKLLAIGLLVSLTTTVPALILYIEYGLLTNSMAYFRENIRILLGILGYGTIMAVTLSLLVFALGSWLQKTVPLVISWACLFVFLPALGRVLRRGFVDQGWLLLSVWRDIRLLGSWCLGVLDSESSGSLVGWAAVVVVAVCVLSAVAIVPRVRAVKVVQ